MGWLEHWKQQPKEASQLDLFGGEAKELTRRVRVDGATVNRALVDEVKARGGTQKTHAQVNAVVTQNMLDCSVDELYRETGAKKNDRSSLPEEAQEALMTGDIAAKHEIVQQDALGHNQIMRAADRGAKKARGLFPW